MFFSIFNKEISLKKRRFKSDQMKSLGFKLPHSMGIYCHIGIYHV